MGTVTIGTSGWSYADWRGRFYPPGLRAGDQLAYASRVFPSLEINRSFYSLLTPAVYRQWHDATPAGFRFALKGSRFITHTKKLRDAETALANFLASGVLCLGAKLGPVLWQLPPGLGFDAGRVGDFLALLPRDTEAAAALAARHDARVDGRAWTATDRKRRLRHALEVRHPSFLVPELVRLARDTGTALVVADSAQWPRVEEVTAGFVYVRLHGSAATYASRYTDAELEGWAERIRHWQAGAEPPDARRITDRPLPRHTGRDVYVYFDNDRDANAPHDALRLAALLGLEMGTPP